jgi:protein tyrosine phosphatase type 4A
MISRPSLIEVSNYRFLVIDTPSRHNVQDYIEVLRHYNAVVLVRTCESLYDDEQFISHGIQTAVSSIQALYYNDGTAPPKHIIREWLGLVKACFARSKLDGSRPCIAVHCMAGLGRAPVMVAIALIEAGLDYLSVVVLIREKRRGSLNENQLNYLRQYTPTRALMEKTACCILQ